MFGAHRVDEQLAKALDRKVWLPSGGSLVIDRTEAMTVVDVNTGKFTGQGGNLEETVTKNNLEAAEEIVRQLRLRDLGGIIVIDFIDMVLESNRDLVLRRLLECLGRDRTKHQVAEVTSLGLVQMTRKRVGQGLLEAFSETCEACHGRGYHIATEPVESRGGSAERRAGSSAAVGPRRRAGPAQADGRRTPRGPQGRRSAEKAEKAETAENGRRAPTSAREGRAPDGREPDGRLADVPRSRSRTRSRPPIAPRRSPAERRDRARTGTRPKPARRRPQGGQPGDHAREAGAGRRRRRFDPAPAPFVPLTVPPGRRARTPTSSRARAPGRRRGPSTCECRRASRFPGCTRSSALAAARRRSPSATSSRSTGSRPSRVPPSSCPCCCSSTARP